MIVVEIESEIGFQLPDDYKFYLRNYLGIEQFIGPEFVTLWDLNDLLNINKEYEIIENLPRTIGIGGNGNSEFIAIELTNDNKYRIVASPFIDLNKQYHIEVGCSFTDFFERLEKGKKWFDEI